jgi:hypothetical protein
MFRTEGGVKYFNHLFNTESEATAFAQQRQYTDFIVVTESEFRNYITGIRQQQQQSYATTYQAPRTRVNIEEYEQPNDEQKVTKPLKPVIVRNYKPHFIKKL